MRTAFETALQAFVNQGHEIKIRKDGTTINIRIGASYIVAAQSFEEIGELMIEGAIHQVNYRVDGGTKQFCQDRWHGVLHRYKVEKCPTCNEEVCKDIWHDGINDILKCPSCGLGSEGCYSPWHILPAEQREGKCQVCEMVSD